MYVNSVQVRVALVQFLMAKNPFLHQLAPNGTFLLGLIGTRNVQIGAHW